MCMCWISPLHSELLYLHCKPYATYCTLVLLYSHANEANLNLKKKKKKINVMFVFPSIFVHQRVAVSCWSVQRADRERLTYGKAGRREGERAQHTGGGKDKK